MGTPDHRWVGRHRIRAGRVDGNLVLVFSRVTTQAGRLRQAMGDFFRKDYPRQRPGAGPFEVTIWVVGGAARFDVDNVAKACLDALSGPVWHDDSQVCRLTVEKLADKTVMGLNDAIVIHARSYAAVPADDSGLEALVDRVGSAPDLQA